MKDLYTEGEELFGCKSELIDGCVHVLSDGGDGVDAHKKLTCAVNVTWAHSKTSQQTFEGFLGNLFTSCHSITYFSSYIQREPKVAVGHFICVFFFPHSKSDDTHTELLKFCMGG